MISRLHLTLALVLLCGLVPFQPAAAQCVAGDPVGKYTGSATSGQAGPLDITLNLLCDKGAYSGTMNTSVGVYTVASGSFQAGTLKLDLVSSGNHIAVELKRSGDDFEGTFTSADDSGPVTLQRALNAVPPAPKAT